MFPTSPARALVDMEYMKLAKTPDECKREIRTFIVGGVPGIARLHEVLPSIFDFFGVITDESKCRILRECGLCPARYEGSSHITFKLPAEFGRGRRCCILSCYMKGSQSDSAADETQEYTWFSDCGSDNPLDYDTSSSSSCGDPLAERVAEQVLTTVCLKEWCPRRFSAHLNRVFWGWWFWLQAYPILSFCVVQ